MEDAQPTHQGLIAIPEKPYTPLTLEFEPSNPYPDSPDPTERSIKPICVAEPSMEFPGRVFMGVNPFGKRWGVHMTEGETRKVRDHLTQLLMEQPIEDTPATPAIRSRRRPRAIRFRLEFELPFGIQGILGRLK